MSRDHDDAVADRLTMLELEELGGRAAPPDRTAAVLDRLRAAGPGGARDRARVRQRLLAAALVGFGVAATVAVMVALPASREPAAAPALAEHPLADLAPVARPQPARQPVAASPATAEPKGTAAHPKGTDPADLAAARSAEAMLAAEGRLAQRLARGDLPGGRPPLDFATLRSWTYTDGLDGMPPSVRALDGTQVSLLGFMLPIDEVEQITEFLLVESLWACCYGTPPDIHGIVRIVMPPGSTTDYSFEPLLVTGTLRIEATVEDGYVVDIYQLRATSVQPL
jgi:hypothetical protein